MKNREEESNGEEEKKGGEEEDNVIEHSGRDSLKGAKRKWQKHLAHSINGSIFQKTIV
jgi:hypothetical protein